MSVNAVDQTTGNTTPLAGNTNNLVGNLSALTTNTKSDAVGAINEVNQTKQNATDNNLQTTDKTIVGGINELRSGLTNVTTGNFAAETGVTIVSSSLKKSVNTVTFIAVLQKVMVLNENNLLGIVPNGFRPSSTIVTMAWNDTKECFMKLQLSSSSGGLYVEATPETADAAAQNVFVYVTYIAS